MSIWRQSSFRIRVIERRQNCDIDLNSKRYKKEKYHPAIDLNAVKEKETFFNRINIVSTYLTDKYIHIFIYKNVGDRQKK